MSETSLEELKQPSAGLPTLRPQKTEQDKAMMALDLASPFSSVHAFNTAQRMAAALNTSTLVPTIYQGEENIGNVLIALEMAQRIGCSVLAVVQNLNVIHNRPTWSGKFIIAAINQSGLFAEPLHFQEVGTKGQDDWGYYAETTTHQGRTVRGPTITIQMAKDEGWFKRNPKWQTIPELMLRYRAGSWFGNTECPEITMGISTREEVRDIIDVDPVSGDIIENDVPETVSLNDLAGKTINEAAIGEKLAEEEVPLVDSEGVEFDPEFHVAHDGNPVMNKDGTFRKRPGAAEKLAQVEQETEPEPDAGQSQGEAQPAPDDGFDFDDLD